MLSKKLINMLNTCNNSFDSHIKYNNLTFTCIQTSNYMYFHSIILISIVYIYYKVDPSILNSVNTFCKITYTIWCSYTSSIYTYNFFKDYSLENFINKCNDKDVLFYDSNWNNYIILCTNSNYEYTYINFISAFFTYTIFTVWVALFCQFIFDIWCYIFKKLIFR